MSFIAGFERLVTWIAFLAAGLFTAAGCMLVYEVMARYFFIAPTIWAAELSQLCLIWGTLMAMAWALALGRHIAVDAVVNRLPPSGQRWMRIAAMGFTATFSLIVAFKGSEIFVDSFVRGRTTGSMLDLPQWFTELPIVLGFVLLFIQAMIEIIKAFRGDGEAVNEAQK